MWGQGATGFLPIRISIRRWAWMHRALHTPIPIQILEKLEYAQITANPGTAPDKWKWSEKFTLWYCAAHIRTRSSRMTPQKFFNWGATLQSTLRRTHKS